MRNLVWGSLLPFLVLSTSAFATTMEEQDSYWVSYNFHSEVSSDAPNAPVIYNGKEVSSVWVHTGVLRGGGDTCGNPNPGPAAGDWSAATGAATTNPDLKMTVVGNHFFAKTRLDTSTSECQVGVVGPMAQYWVYFTDGSPEVTVGPDSVPFTDTTIRIDVINQFGVDEGELDWTASATANDKAFASVNDASSTSATRLKWQHAD